MTTDRTTDKLGYTREAWLRASRHCFEKLFERIGYRLPDNVNICCGFPSRGGLAIRRRTLGQCWMPDGKAGAKFEIFINPVLDDAVEVLAVVAHELVHVVVGKEAGHRAPFKSCALAIGLTGRMTATIPGVGLRRELEHMVATLGPYPHRALNVADNPEPKQPTRGLKVICRTCGYTARITQKWVDRGLPTCPCGTRMSTVSFADLLGISVTRVTLGRVA